MSHGLPNLHDPATGAVSCLTYVLRLDEVSTSCASTMSAPGPLGSLVVTSERTHTTPNTTPPPHSYKSAGLFMVISCYRLVFAIRKYILT